VFNRYSLFGSALLGTYAPCFVIQSCIVGSPRRSELMPELDWTPLQRVGEGEGEVWDSWIAHTIWEPIAFRSLLLAIADDQEAHIAFLSEVTDCAFIPYDGGADGFSFDTSLLKRLSGEFTPWRSSPPSGLGV